VWEGHFGGFPTLVGIDAERHHVAMRTLFALLVTGVFASAAPAPTLVHGVVRIGPTTPVCRAGLPCDKPAAGVVLTFAHSERLVRTTTDAKGRYRVSLAPGRWTARTRTGMRIMPQTFVIPHASTALRDFSIDTGIR
jgi:hypothetical protein